MNFFGGSKAQEPQGPDPVFAAKTEFEMYTGENNKTRLLPLITNYPSAHFSTHDHKFTHMFMFHTAFSLDRFVQENWRFLF